MKPNKPSAPTPILASDAEVRQNADRARTELIESQRERAGELLSRATNKAEALAASQQAGAEIAKSELGENRMSWQPSLTHDQNAHVENLEVVSREMQATERQRQAEILARHEADQKRREDEIAFIANEMKASTTRYFSGGG